MDTPASADPATTFPAPPRGWLARLIRGPWLMSLALFALTLALDTRHNDFPYTYHPDEHGKVEQIIARTRNFHHPLLMLTVTDFALRAGFVERTPQNVVVAGRWVSAAFAAGSVVALALIAWLAYGAPAGWAAGLLLAFEDDLFKTAHYMKEDPALMFGIALALLAAHVWWLIPGRRSLRFLGIACGLAAAGKYIGVITLLFAVPLVLMRVPADPALSRGARWKKFALAFGITFLLANTPLFVREISSPFRSVRNEVEGVTAGHRGLTRKVPHALYLDRLKRNTPPAIAVLAGFYGLSLLATARRRNAAEWLTLLLPIGYVAMISCSPKVADRYLLPGSALLAFLAALGAAEIARALDAPASRLRRALAFAALAAATAWALRGELPPFREALASYATDDHAALAAWIAANLPANAVIAEDHRVNLSASEAGGVSKDARISQTVLDSDFAADLGTLDELRKKGVTHVAVCRENYARFFEEKITPGKNEKESYDRRKAFYNQLFAAGALVKEWPPGRITYLQPGMKLYRISPAD